MLNIQASPATQVLLRLPVDVATKLAQAVPSRKRNQFLVDLVRHELEKENEELVAACEALNAIEAAHPELLAEAQEWLDADLTGPVADWNLDFDRKSFEREFAIAQANLRTNKPAKQPKE